MQFRKFVARLALAFGLAATALPALAFEILPYDAAVATADIKAGKSVVIHVYAPWCLQCRAQETILNRMSAEPGYEKVAFFRVDYDKQKDIVAALDVPRSTLIVYKGGAELAKKSWGTTEAWVREVLAPVQ